MIPKPKSLIEWMNTHSPIKTRHRYSYACFECRKAFKERKPFEGVSCCPECGGNLWDMGLHKGTRLLDQIEKAAGIRKRD